ncbi:MAG: hypothetical protein AAF636_18675 [Pseudomonadota bacterium]
MTKAIRTFLSLLFGLGFFFMIAALSWLILEPHLPFLGETRDTLRCVAGIPAADSDCVQSILDELEADRADIERQKEALESAIAAQSFVFTQGEELKDHISLVVGTLYQDAAAQTGFLRAYCWAVIDNQGLDPRVGLAIREADGRVTALPLSVADLSLLDMQTSDIEAAREACPFEGVS